VRLRGSIELRINLLGLLRFLPFFVWESVLGGLDVVSRVMRPTMRVAPGFFDYRLRLQTSSARLLFVNSLSLLPGTLAADLDGDSVRIHALDLGADREVELIRLERAVAAVYGEVI
jgi:multicomponent Na+:H+ antiporter subunit E